MNATINIKGGNKLQRSMIKNTIMFCIGKLKLNRFKFTLDVVVRDLSHKHYYGVCSDTNRRHIRIDLERRNTVMEMIRTVCHEMIHCKQYLRDELQIRWDNKKNDWKYIWKGTDWSKQVLASMDCQFDLTKSPWEIEAYRDQMDLALEAFIYNKI